MDACYTIIKPPESTELPTIDSLKSSLEKGNDDVKVTAMKKILCGMMNGEPYASQLLMHVIRFVMPSKHKPLKKLLHLFWELCPKHQSDGKLKQEMILVCNALRNDLQHPNEYIRGASLRMVCKLRDAEILEPLAPSCRQNLEHRHPYVRQNAETDMATRRNAFIMLQNTSPDKAIAYLATVANLIPTFDENLQLAVIETVRKEARANAKDRPRYMKLLFALLKSPNSSVQYEAASSLMSLTSNAVAAQACMACYIELLNKEANHNVKLIVLKKIVEMLEKHEKLGEDLVIDLLRGLAAPDIDVRRKCCQVALEMTNARNVESIAQFLKKELLKTSEPSMDLAIEYRQLIIQTLHACVLRYPSCVPSVVYVLMDYLVDTSYVSAVEVVAFVREVMEKCPELRLNVLEKLLNSLMDLKSGKVMRGVLWILGEYTPLSLASKTLQVIELALGDLIAPITSEPSESGSSPPFFPTSPQLATASSPILTVSTPTQNHASSSSSSQPSTKVLADGTYAMQTSMVSPRGSSAPADHKRKPPLFALLHNGDYFTATVLSTCLTKLCARLQEENMGDEKSNDQQLMHGVTASSMRIMSKLLQLGMLQGMDEDACHRIHQCLLAISKDTPPLVHDLFLHSCRTSFRQWLLKKDEKQAMDSQAKKKRTNLVQDIETPLHFHLLKSMTDTQVMEDEYAVDLTKATGAGEPKMVVENKLNRLIQLTGFSDPIYAEAYVHVHQYDILLDVLLVNQTTAVLQNVTLEFATLGDLKLVERPLPFTLAPKSFHTLKANIKVSSTETGIIFGNLVYDASALDSYCISLQDIFIDIMDYIHPAPCDE
ncbi:Coatomer subunit beta, partial [Coelomomyces lativittatus]